MALLYPDILQHNNSTKALVDITEVRGSSYPIDLLSDTGSIPVDKRKIGAIIFVSSSQDFYGFYGQTTASWDVSENWRLLNYTGSLVTTSSFNEYTGSSTSQFAGTSSYSLTSSYSTNISGSTNYVPKFSGSNSLGNSLLYDDGTNVGIGTTSPGAKLDVAGDVLINGLTIGRGGGNISTNTANGYRALFSNTSGSANTANGSYTLYNNLTGGSNVASGYAALYNNTTGQKNTAVGLYSLFSNTSGSANTAFGHLSLRSNTVGVNNTALIAVFVTMSRLECIVRCTRSFSF